jgi:hypothetical protein
MWRISKWMDEGKADLASLVVNLLVQRAKHKRNWKQTTSEFVVDFINDICSSFGVLWEGSATDARWLERGYIDLGTLQGKRRARNVPSMFKRAIVNETMNLRGEGLATPAALISGMHVARKTGQNLRLGGKLSKMAKGRYYGGRKKYTTAGQEMRKASKLPHRNIGYRAERSECWNYHFDCRTHHRMGTFLGFYSRSGVKPDSLFITEAA